MALGSKVKLNVKNNLIMFVWLVNGISLICFDVGGLNFAH